MRSCLTSCQSCGQRLGCYRALFPDSSQALFALEKKSRSKSTNLIEKATNNCFDKMIDCQSTNFMGDFI